MFGNSRTFKNIEKKEIEQVIETYGKGFSPTIILHSNRFANSMSARVSVIENQSEWKEVSFSVDRYEVLDAANAAIQTEIVVELCSIFTDMVESIKPYYGIGATEIEGLVERPEKLAIGGNMLGDIAYFSAKAAKNLKIREIEGSYECKKLSDSGWLLTRRINLFRLVGEGGS